MSFGIDTRQLRKLIDLYRPCNKGEEMKYMVYLRGEEELFVNLETSPFQGINQNSVEQRRLYFGSNVVEGYDHHKLKKLVVDELDQSVVKLALLVFLICLILSCVSNYSDLQISYLENLLYLGMVTLNFAITIWKKYQKIKSNQAILRSVTLSDNCLVIRDNTASRLGVDQLVVGDLIELKQGQTIPVDGWLVDAVDLVVLEKNSSSVSTVAKGTLRSCIAQLQQKAKQSNTSICKNQNDLISQKSPIVISGSLVKEGTGRMIVLQVGKLSKEGQFTSLCRRKNLKGHLELKLDHLMNTICVSTVKFFFLYFLVLALRFFTKHLITSDWNSLSVSIESLMVGFVLVLINLGPCLAIGIGLGLAVIKLKLWWEQGIQVKFGQDCSVLASISHICYEKQLQKTKINYHEWWNDSTQLFGRVDSTHTEPNDLLPSDFLHFQFQKLLNYSFALNNSKNPGQIFSITPNSKLRPNEENDWMFFEQYLDGQTITYICQDDQLRFVELKVNQKEEGYLFLKGQSQDLLECCSFMISKTNGQIQSLTENVRNQIKEVIRSMNRRLTNSFAVAYTDLNIEASQVQILQSRKLIFLCLMGITTTNDHQEFQLVNQLKENGINMIFTSPHSLEQSVSRSKEVGISNCQKDTLALKGADYLDLVRGVVCHKCKKSICNCLENDYVPTLKNMDEFQRIIRYLRVLGEADYYSKYALMVGLLKNNHEVCVIGKDQEDIPAMAISTLSICSAESKLDQVAHVIMPNYSLKCVYSLVLWSRFSYDFVSKFVQLVLTNLLVGAILIFGCGIVAEQYLFKLLQILWLQMVINPLLAINLALEKPSDSLRERRQSFDASKILVNDLMYKNIICQAVMQIFILSVVLFAGHYFIPEQQDDFDLLKGFEWSDKYANPSKKTVANGLYVNILFDTSSYWYSWMNWQVFSRHITIVYNTFALMQIFNYLNCRKLIENDVNVLEGWRVINFLLFMATIVLQFLFIQYGGNTCGFYFQGLTFTQWLISLAFAISVLLIGVLVRLLPSFGEKVAPKRKWINRSYNLGLKSVSAKVALAEWQTEGDIQSKSK